MVVGRTQYCYISFFCNEYHYDGLQELRVQLAEEPQQVLRAQYGYDRVQSEYSRVGKHIRGYTLPPYIVRQAILVGLRKGWHPTKRGIEIDIGVLDDQIDWSELAPKEAPAET